MYINFDFLLNIKQSNNKIATQLNENASGENDLTLTKPIRSRTKYLRPTSNIKNVNIIAKQTSMFLITSFLFILSP